MKLNLAMALAFVSLSAGPAFCGTINFTGNNTTFGHSHIYGSGSDSVTAYAFTNAGGSDLLYGKNSGGSENGVGIFGTPSNEISNSTFIELDLSNITNPFSLLIGSTQNTEGFHVCFSSMLGMAGGGCSDFATPGADPFATPYFTLPKGDKYISIEADGGKNGQGNVLLNSLTTSATPEPNSLVLLGTGIIGAAGFIRRRFRGMTLAADGDQS